MVSWERYREMQTFDWKRVDRNGKVIEKGRAPLLITEEGKVVPVKDASDD